MSPHQPKPDHDFSEIHLVETPEQLQLQFALGGVGSRSLALLIDLAIQFSVILVLFLIVAFAACAAKMRSPWVVAFLTLGFFAVQYGYFILFEIWWRGQTPGKRSVGLRVIKASGRSLSAGETIGRNLLRIVDQLPGFYLVGLICMLANRANQRLGDLVAGSIVIRESAADITPVAWQPVTETPGLSPLGAKALSQQDLVLIDSFLSRREQLDGGTRSRMADRIVAHLAPRLQLTREQLARPETTLEALAWESRR